MPNIENLKPTNFNIATRGRQSSNIQIRQSRVCLNTQRRETILNQALPRNKPDIQIRRSESSIQLPTNNTRDTKDTTPANRFVIKSKKPAIETRHPKEFLLAYPGFTACVPLLDDPSASSLFARRKSAKAPKLRKQCHVRLRSSFVCAKKIGLAY